MDDSFIPIEISDDLRRGLEVHAFEAGKTPSQVLAEALEAAGITPLDPDQREKRMHGSQ